MFFKVGVHGNTPLRVVAVLYLEMNVAVLFVVMFMVKQHGLSGKFTIKMCIRVLMISKDGIYLELIAEFL